MSQETRSQEPIRENVATVEQLYRIIKAHGIPESCKHVNGITNEYQFTARRTYIV